MNDKTLSLDQQPFINGKINIFAQSNLIQITLFIVVFWSIINNINIILMLILPYLTK
jgi:hypothetical protein